MLFHTCVMPFVVFHIFIKMNAPPRPPPIPNCVFSVFSTCVESLCVCVFTLYLFSQFLESTVGHFFRVHILGFYKDIFKIL